MTNFNTLVWNTGGLNAPHKRTCVLGFLRRKKADIALKGHVRRLADKFYHVIPSSSASTKVWGVAIVAKCSVNVKVLDIWADSLGRITTGKIECSNRKIALVSIYASNQFDADFYNELTDMSFLHKTFS